MAFERSLQASSAGVLATNKVIKNTYILLSATLLFSALMAGVSIVTAMPPMAYMIAVIGAFVLGIFVLPKTANSGAGQKAQPDIVTM